MSSSNLIENLISFNLTRQEATIYVSFLTRGQMSGYEVAKETLNEFSQKTEEPQETITPDIQIKQEIQEEVKEDIKIEHPKEKKSVAILYCQDSSNDKIKNIIKLREILKNTRDKNASIDDLLVLISEITADKYLN